MLSCYANDCAGMLLDNILLYIVYYINILVHFLFLTVPVVFCALAKRVFRALPSVQFKTTSQVKFSVCEQITTVVGFLSAQELRY